MQIERLSKLIFEVLIGFHEDKSKHTYPVLARTFPRCTQCKNIKYIKMKKLLSMHRSLIKF